MKNEKAWVSMKVPDSWKGGESMFKCGLRVMKDEVGVRNENAKLKRQMEQMKNEDDLKNCVYENNENFKIWVTIEKLVRVE